jgi:hypothetical protein
MGAEKGLKIKEPPGVSPKRICARFRPTSELFPAERGYYSTARAKNCKCFSGYRHDAPARFDTFPATWLR